MKSDNDKRRIADARESEKRVNKAIEMLLCDNTSRAEWVIYCKDVYNIESRQSDVYWRKAKEKIRGGNEPSGAQSSLQGNDQGQSPGSG